MLRYQQGDARVAAGLVPADTGLRLHGHMLTLARAAWLAASLFAVALFLASLPESIHLLQTPCPVSSCGTTTGQLSAGDIVVLHRLGISLDAYAAYWTLLDVGLGLACVAVGVVLVWRKSDEWMVLLVSLMLIGLGAYLNLSNVAASASMWRLPAEIFGALNGMVMLGTLALFPTGRPAPRWAGWLPLPTPVASLAYLLILRPRHVAGWSWFGNPLNGLAFWGSWIVLTGAQVYRYRRVSTAIERQQTKWVAFGFVVVLVGSLVSAAVNSGLSLERGGLLYLLLDSATTVVVLILPLTFAVAILRYRLWDIDLILNRTLVYTALTVSVVGLYILVVAGLGALVQTSGRGALSLLATVAVALLVHPLRVRLQRGVNRLMYGDRDDPYAVVSRLGRQLEGTLAPEAVLPVIVRTVAQALKLPYAAIALRQGGEDGVVAEVGTPVAAPLRLPLVYQGEAVGELALGPRPGEGTFSPTDRRLLEDLARQAGVAASAVRLTADLQHSRERLVTAREEERRRLRRDLHDGLGPALASVALMADAARNLLAHDPAAAGALLGNLKAEAQAATAEVRRVVYELRPPALDQLGLVPALREQAAQYGQGGLRVAVEAPDRLPALSAAVEVAAYRIVLEALTNVLRHAGARSCTVRLRVADGLQLEIADDGRGWDGARPGVGLSAMRERAEELGGWCVVEPRPEGGTRVRAALPLAAHVQGGAG